MRGFYTLMMLSLFGIAPLDSAQEETAAPLPRVEVARPTSDEAIASRLKGILEATGWFENTEISVDEGVVFLSGVAANEERREWATRLSERTNGVVAAVNRMQLEDAPSMDLSPAWAELHELRRKAVRNSPLIGLALILLIFSWIAAK